MPDILSQLGRTAIASLKGGKIPFSQSANGGTGFFGGIGQAGALDFWTRIWERGISAARESTDSYDVNSNAGDVRLNSLVSSLLTLRINAVNEAPPAIQRRDVLGRWQYETDHPLLDLLFEPNPWRDGPTLFGDTIADLTWYGNAYWYLLTNRYGEVLQILPISPEEIAPRWARDSKNFIDFYEYKPNLDGQSRPLAVRDVVHFRSELVNPQCNRLGRSRLQALYPELCVDREDSLATAYQAHNLGAPGAIISPKAPEDVEWDDETAEKMERSYRARTSGSKRGLPLVLTEAVDVVPFGVKPSEMATDRAMNKAAQRICGIFATHPALIGGEKSSMAMMQQAQKMFWEMGVLPEMTRLSSAITQQLLPRYEKPSRKVRFGFDLREVRSLSEDLDRRDKRVVEAFRWNIIDLDTAMTQMELQPAGGELGKKRYLEFVAAQSSNGAPGGDGGMMPSGGGTGGGAEAEADGGQNPASAANSSK